LLAVRTRGRACNHAGAHAITRARVCLSCVPGWLTRARALSDAVASSAQLVSEIYSSVRGRVSTLRGRVLAAVVLRLQVFTLGRVFLCAAASLAQEHSSEGHCKCTCNPTKCLIFSKTLDYKFMPN